MIQPCKTKMHMHMHMHMHILTLPLDHDTLEYKGFRMDLT